MLLVSLFVGISKAPPVQYIPHRTTALPNFGPVHTAMQYIFQAGNTLHEQAIIALSCDILRRGKILATFSQLGQIGQICPQYSSDCRETIILTVGCLPYGR